MSQLIYKQYSQWAVSLCTFFYLSSFEWKKQLCNLSMCVCQVKPCIVLSDFLGHQLYDLLAHGCQCASEAMLFIILLLKMCNQVPKSTPPNKYSVHLSVKTWWAKEGITAVSYQILPPPSAFWNLTKNVGSFKKKKCSWKTFRLVVNWIRLYHVYCYSYGWVGLIP